MPQVKINEVDIYYQDHGKGFPIVFAHGLGGDHTMWLNQIQYFKNKYRVVVWDCRGHGRSEVTETGYSISQFAQDQYELMKYLGIEKAHICGLSMGGWIASTFTIAHPECVASLTLSNSAGFLSAIPPDQLKQQRQMMEAGAHIAEKYGRKKLTDMTIPMLFSQEFIKNNPIIVDLVRKQLDADPGVGYARTVTKVFVEAWESPSYIVKAQYAKIKAPTLIIAGDKDVMTPMFTQEALKDAIPNSRLEIIPGAGHVPIIEKPDMWNRLVGEFIENIC